MALVSTLQGKSFTKSFAFNIPNFLFHAKLLSKSVRETLDSPDFKFVGLENEEYDAGINLKPEHSPLRRGDGIQTWMSMQIDFPEGYEDHSGSESENDSDSSNSSSRSRPVKGREFNVGVKSVIEISALTSTFDEPLLFLQDSDWHVFSVNSRNFDSSNIFETTILDVTYADLEKYWADEDEGARFTVTLTFFYISREDSGWKPENSVPSFNWSRAKGAKRPAPYIDCLTKRQKTDVIIECGGNEFPVHKLVLSSVSPFFDRMFNTDMKENEAGRIKIKDIPPETFQLMLDFIYTGSLFGDEQAKRRPSSDGLLIQLLNCAEKYGIDELKEQVENEICANLTVTNAIKFVDALNTHRADEAVVRKVLEFCKTNLAAFPKDTKFKKFLLKYTKELIPSPEPLREFSTLKTEKLGRGRGSELTDTKAKVSIALVTTLPCKSFTKTFAFDIPNFRFQAQVTSKFMRKKLSSPEFNFEGLENEKYRGEIYLEPKSPGCRRDDGIHVRMSMDIDFPEGCEGGSDSDTGRIFQLKTTGPSFSVGIKSLMEISALTSTSDEPILFQQKNNWTALSHNSKNFKSANRFETVFHNLKYEDSGTLWKNQDDRARISVTLTFYYASEASGAGNEWQPEHAVPSFNPGRKRSAANPPATYIDCLAKRQKTDVTIDCGWMEFPAHKLVLSSVSHVFDRMLNTDMKEKETGRIKINDVRPETVQLMLDFIYTGQLNFEKDTNNGSPLDELLVQLLNCAEKYEINDLKDQVGHEICENLTVMNAIKFVDTLNTLKADEGIVGKVLEFCKKNLAAFPKDAKFKKFLLKYTEALI